MRLAIALTLSLSGVSAANGGVFALSTNTNYDLPQIIVHPYGYDGSGGPLTVRVCADVSATTPYNFVPFIQDAVNMWNTHPVGTPNCNGPCVLFGENAPSGPYSPTSTLVHEFGHCLLGLGETNNEDESDHTNQTNYTNSYDEDYLTAGPDTYIGTGDDMPHPYPGTRVVHWFRIGINDPFHVNGVTIDNSTYSRRISDLPPGDTWPANGNRDVGRHTGYPDNSHSVMFERASPRTTFDSLIPDDYNNVLYAERGLDETVSGDDYTLTLEYTSDCSTANVEVYFQQMDPGEAGVCGALYAPLPIPGEPLVRHYALDSTIMRATVTLSSKFRWTVRLLLFADFETGDTSQWSAVTP